MQGQVPSSRAGLCFWVATGFEIFRQHVPPRASLLQAKLPYWLGFKTPHNPPYPSPNVAIQQTLITILPNSRHFSRLLGTQKQTRLIRSLLCGAYVLVGRERQGASK